MSAPQKITGSLLDHDAEAQRLLALLEEHTGDEDAQAAILEEYMAAAEKVGIKLDNTAGVIEELNARAEFFEAEGERWSDRAARLKKQAGRLKMHLQRYMEAREMKRFEGARYTLSLRTAGGKRKVEIVDLEALPEGLVRTVTTTTQRPDKEQLLKRLEEGEDIPGAYLAPRKVSLKIG